MDMKDMNINFIPRTIDIPVIGLNRIILEEFFN